MLIEFIDRITFEHGPHAVQLQGAGPYARERLCSIRDAIKSELPTKQLYPLRYELSKWEKALAFKGHVGGVKSPPLNAAFLFYLFLDAKTCDAVVGDLEERYRLIYKKFGARRAKLWYWKETIRTTGPSFWAWGKKAMLKPVIGVIGWAMAKGLIGHDSWLAALVEMWKRIRS